MFRVWVSKGGLGFWEVLVNQMEKNMENELEVGIM